MQTVPDRIRAQARRSPDAVAVESGADRLTYAQLIAVAYGLASRLRELDVRRGEPVAVAVARGVDLVPALLGVQLAEAAYVPLDPEHPAERSNYVLQDTGARILVTARSAGFPGLRPAITVALDEVAPRPEPADLPPLDPDSPAYAIYTSGSTGRPKGVLATHRSLLNHHLSMRRHPGFADDVVMPAVATVSFDPSTVELFLPLMTGGRVVVARQNEIADPHRLAALLERSQARILQATPVTWRLLTESGWSPPPGFTVLTGGERMPATLAERLLAAGAVMWDLYGPTETTVWATMTRYEHGAAPQFHTADGASLYVLDDTFRPVPTGEAGELYIAGPGLAFGYLGHPALTAERYVAHPFADSPGARLYRTGDIARRHPDGRIEILGRADDQIKIRGFRIEPGEIESALTGHPGVAGAVVRAVEESGGERRLVGYVRPSDPTDPPEIRRLRAHLAKSLPSYMIPAQFVVLDEFPTTATGKVNRPALPPPPPLAPREDVPAADTTQQVVRAILAEVLERPDIGLYDDFFALGGDSLAAVRTIQRLNERLSRDIPVNALFEERTVYGLALRIDADADANAAPEPQLVPHATAGRAVRLSPAQRRLLLHQDTHPDSTALNEPIAIRIPEPLDLLAVRAAVAGLLERHEILRTRYEFDKAGRRIPVVLPPAPVRLDIESGDPRDVLAAQLARPFDPAAAPPVRFRLVRKDPTGPAVLLLVVHRVAADARSRALIARELRAACRGRTVAAPALTYADYAEWRRELAASPAAARHLEFWRSALTGVRPARLRTDRPRPARRDWRGGSVRFTVSGALAQRLRDVALEYDANASVALLAAQFGVLERYSESYGGDLTVGVPVERRRPEVEDLVGAFEDTAVIRVGLGARPAFDRLVVRVRDAALAARDHAALPFEDIVAGVYDLLPDGPEPGRNPLFDVWSEYQGWNDASEDAAAGFALPSAPGTEFDLHWRVAEQADGGFDGRIDYAVDLFDESTVEQMAEDYLDLLRAAADDPTRPLALPEPVAAGGTPNAGAAL